MNRFSFAFAVLLALAGCSIKPVQFASTPVRACTTEISYRLSVGPASRTLAPDPLGAAIRDAYAVQPRSLATPSSEPVSPSMLFLSGGSQDGAFGAGLLAGWAQERTKLKGPGAGLPRFRVVTGISTGALQATFAFLDDPAEIVRRYSIRNERELLQPFVSGGLDGGGALGKLAAVRAVARRGAVASLQPVRAQLRDLIDRPLLQRIDAEANEGRLLLVAAVEMDSGDARVFDLTKAATRYVESGNEAYRDCYIEALVASSSVPIAALPVFIDGEMFIDGGARFGVVSDKLEAELAVVASRSLASIPKNLFIIVNGNLKVGARCDLKDCDQAQGGVAAAVPMHGKWTFPDLAFRAVSVLINQSYTTSVFMARQSAAQRGFVSHLATIEDVANAHPARVGLPPEPDAIRPCGEWRDIDQRVDAPLEFHPRFMRCLIAYGAQRPEAAAWAALE